MEVGDQMIDRLEAVARIDKDRCPAGLCADMTGLVCDGLERARRRRADRPDVAACIACVVDDLRGLLVHDIELGVHDMIGDLVLLDRTERAQTDVQRDERELYALVLQRFEQLLRKVQTCGRRGSRAGRLGVDGLIALRVFELFLDVRRQRHRAELVENLKENALIMEADQSVAVRLHRLDRRGQQAVAKRQLNARGFQ